jgi:MFS family permease
LDPYASLRIPNFRRVLISYAMATMAREGQMVVVGWQVYDATHDPLSLGLIGLSEALPFIAVALYAGHLADRVSRRKVAVAGTFALLLSAIALFVFTVRNDVLVNGRVWPIYLVIFLSGIARSFTRPATTALSADVVPRELFPNSIAWRSSTWQFSAIAGPAIGGLLYGFAGVRGAYATVSVLMAIALVGLMFVAVVDKIPERSEMTIGDSLRAGLRFLRRQSVVLPAMTLDLFSVLFGGATALLPIFAHLLHVGPEGLGVLRAAPAVGSVIIGVVIAHRPPIRRAGPVLLTCVAMFGLTTIAFALSRNFWLSAFLLMVGGVFDNVSVVIRGTLVQTLTPTELLGRVSAVNQIFIGASNEIGAFESGVAARLLGTVPSVIFGGVMTLLVVAITTAVSPSLRRMRELV